jgi:hypothetical protein
MSIELSASGFGMIELIELGNRQTEKKRAQFRYSRRRGGRRISVNTMPSWEVSMLRKIVLLLCGLALLAPVLAVAGDNGGEGASDTRKSISVVIRHCTS